MAQSKNASPELSLRSILALPLTVLLLVVVLLIATLIGGAGILLVGRILSQFFGVSIFEASLIALGVALGIAYALVRIAIPQHVVEPAHDDWDEDEDWDDYDEDSEDEEDDAIIPPHSRNDPCPCGSGKKYKHCHGKNA